MYNLPLLLRTRGTHFTQLTTMNIRTLIFTSAIGFPLALHADADPITLPVDVAEYRAIAGESAVTTGFDVTSQSLSTTVFDITTLAVTVPGGSDAGVAIEGVLWEESGQPPVPSISDSLSGASILSSNTGLILTNTNLENSLAGDFVTVEVTTSQNLADPNPVWAPLSASATINAVSDRTLTAATIDLGRRMYGSTPEEITSRPADVIQVTTTGSDTERTRLDLADPTNATAENGLTLTGSAQSFDDSGDFMDVTVVADDFTRTTDVVGTNYKVVDIGDAGAITGEGLAGETVQDTLNVGYHWNNVLDRTLSASKIDLGRYMVGTVDASTAIDRTAADSDADTFTVGTYGSDENFTRLNLGAISESDGSLTATGAGGAYDDGGDTTTVSVDAVFERTTAVAGEHTQVIDIGDNGSITTGETDPDLTGQNVQGNLEIGYVWHNLQDNALVARDMLVIEGENRSGSRTYETSVGNANTDYDQYTILGHLSPTDQVTTGNNYSAGSMTTLATNQEVQAVKEAGVIGDQDISAANDTFSAKLASVSAATYSATDESTLLASGDDITIDDTGSGDYQNSVAIYSTTTSTGYDLTNDGSSSLNHGNRVVGVDYIGDSVAGALTRVAKGTAEIRLYDVANESALLADANDAGFSGSSIRHAYDSNFSTLNYKFETRILAAAAISGSQAITAGDDFGVNGLALTNIDTNTDLRFNDNGTVTTTSAELLDSGSLDATTVTLSFVKLALAGQALSIGEDVNTLAALEDTGSNAGSVAGIFGGVADKLTFVSDIVQVTGLDELFVLEVTFDGSITELDSAAQLVWGTTYDHDGDTETAAQEAWINAVLGNSNIAELNLGAGTLEVDGSATTIDAYLALTRNAGSYEDYLADGFLSDPELGAWGVDTLNGQVWAVIDHNSDFGAAVPEPTTYALIAGVFALAAGIVRRRR